MSKKILVAFTSVEKYPNLNRGTGLWLGEAVHFVKKVEEAGYAVDNVSSKWRLWRQENSLSPFSYTENVIRIKV